MYIAELLVISHIVIHHV